MYTLLSGLYKYMFQKDEYCILILGLDNAGKTVGCWAGAHLTVHLTLYTLHLHFTLNTLHFTLYTYTLQHLVTYDHLLPLSLFLFLLYHVFLLLSGC